MKQVMKLGTYLSSFFSLLILCFIQSVAWAQDKGKDVDVDIDIKKESDTWYTQPWVWVVGGAVFLLLLVALLRGGGKKD